MQQVLSYMEAKQLLSANVCKTSLVNNCLIICPFPVWQVQTAEYITHVLEYQPAWNKKHLVKQITIIKKTNGNTYIYSSFK